MASATRKAKAAAREALAASAASRDLSLAVELFAAGRAIGGSLQLRNLLLDPAFDSARKADAVSAVFGSTFSPAAVALLSTVASQRWSSENDLLAGIEDLGIWAAAASTEVDVAGELFAFERLSSSEPELELAIGSKLGASADKAALVSTLLAGRVSEQTLAIINHLVQQPRGRRVARLVSDAAAIVAEQNERVLATVTTAAPLSEEERARLRASLSEKYGQVMLNELIDASLIGGVRIAVGDHVIDGSVSTRLAELRLQLAG